MQIRKELQSFFPSIFDEDEPVPVADHQDDMEDVASNIQNSFQQTYGWYLVLNRICQNDFTRHEYVYKKNILEVLNQLQFLVDLDKEELRLQKKAQGQI